MSVFRLALILAASTAALLPSFARAGTGGTACPSNVDAYNFPIADPYFATAASLLIPSDNKNIYPAQFQYLAERLNVPLYGDRSAFGYSFFPAEREGAPLIIIVAGLGGLHTEGSVRFLGQAFRAAGFNAIGVSSTLSWAFSLSASRLGTSGFVPDDAIDLYGALQAVLRDARQRYGTKQLRPDVPIGLAGFSLGALTAAHLSAIDEKEGQIGFKSVLMVNPPIDVGHGIATLDALHAVGDQWTAKAKDHLRFRVFDLYTSLLDQPSASLSDLLGMAAQGFGFTQDEVKFLIGDSFRKSLSEMIFASQQVKDRGVLKEPASFFFQNARLAEARRFSYRAYLELFALPAWKERHNSDGHVDEVLRQGGFHSIADHVRRRSNAGQMTMLHNCDDFLLRSEDIPMLKDLMGDRFKLFPAGGHGGNMWMQQNIEQIVGSMLKLL